MKKKSKALRVFIIALAVTCVFIPFIYAYELASVYAAVDNGPSIHNSKYDDQIREAEEEKKRLEEQKAAIEADKNNLQKEYDDLYAYIEELDKVQADLSSQIGDMQVKLAELETEKLETEANLAVATQKMNEQYEYMCARIKYVYENGETTYWDILVKSANFTDMLNRVEYVSEIAEYDDNLLNEYQESVKRVQEYDDILAAQLGTLEEAELTYQSYMDYLDKIKESKNAALEKTIENLGITQELFEEYGQLILEQELTIEQAQALKDKEIQENLKKPDEGPIPGLGSTGSGSVDNIQQTDQTDISGMIWPLPGRGQVSSYFGYRESPGPGASTYHKGIDIPGPYGTPIVASLAGTVTAGYNNSMGYHVWVDHGNGVKTVYMHCSSLAVSSGSYVKQGQVVGYVGNTGISYGNHLHFGVQVYGEYKNPLNYVAY